MKKTSAALVLAAFSLYAWDDWSPLKVDVWDPVFDLSGSQEPEGFRPIFSVNR